MPISNWSTTASDNATADSASGISWPEGMSPAQVNDSSRAMMAEIKKWYDASETNRPTFSAAKSDAIQAVANGNSKVTFNNIIANRGSHFSNSRFTVPTAGLYEFKIAITLRDGTANTGSWAVAIAVNGSVYSSMWQAKTGFYGMASLPITLSLAAADYIEAYVLLDSMSGNPGLDAANRCVFSGRRIG